MCAVITAADALARLPGPEDKPFATIFEHGTLLTEIFAPRGVDNQQPHSRDEIYVVIEGAGEFVCGENRSKIGRSDFIFAPAGIIHRFENFSDDLTVWVMFYGPEGGENDE